MYSFSSEMMRSDLRRRPAFTLVETMVVLGTLALLMALLLPALSSARGQMKMVLCASNLKTVSLSFTLFAENPSARGNSGSALLSRNQFWIDDFQASLYRTGDFWDAPGADSISINSSDELMMCPAGPDELTKHVGQPFGPDAIGPAENVSIGMNGRLSRGVRESGVDGRTLASKEETRVDGSDVLSHPYVPLLFDVDGEEAAARGVSPFYAAPSIGDSGDPYGDDSMWIPSYRHRGGTNVAFVGGHVLSSRNPAAERWDWQYQARLSRVHSSPQ